MTEFCHLLSTICSLNEGKGQKMKEKAICLICGCFIWFLSTANIALAEEPVNIPDTNLKEAIEVELGVSDPNAADMLKLTFLPAWDRGITDITGLEYATNLTELYLYDNQLSDISSISGLVNLTHLSVHNNQVSDISSISGLVNLTNLYLRNNQISNISALLELTNLTYLDLRGNPLSLDAFDIYIPQIFENNTEIYINYDPYVEYTLMISSTDGGSVAIPGEGSFSYPYGGIIPIIATADTGYHFLYWTGTAVDINKVANVMAADTTVNLKYSDCKLEAHFAKEKSVIYVDDDATGTNDGSTWENAYNSLQDALIDANATEKPVEICVAQGVYKPDNGFGIHSGDISASFNLINEVTLSGGFAGTNSVDPNAQDIDLYQTILSGDLKNNDVLNDNSNWYRDSTIRENTRHILTANGTNETAVLDGFRIVGGYYGGAIPMVFEPPSFYGGGMIIISANPIIANCTFTHNMVTMGGGAVAILEKSCPIITNCKFEQNYGWTGGGITVSDSALVLIECRFYKNSASGGGAIFCTTDGSISLYGCSFINNAAYYSGGIIKVPSVDNNINPEIIKENCFARMENCLFIGNTVGNSISLSSYKVVVYGGAWLTNCTFSGNRIIHGAVVSRDTLLENCIIWGNFTIGTHRQRDQFEHSLAHHCCIQNSIFYPNGYGNIYADPCFADPGYWADADDPNIAAEPNDPNAVWIDGDYHLKSQAGRWDPASKSWIQDDVTSPCIDAGDPNMPVGDEPMPNGSIINMGAYGGTPEASKSYTD
jgi:predicted outer membrane repeat protein